MNQILVSQRLYVTKEMKRKNRIYKTIYILSIILVIALLIYFVFEEKTKSEQEAVSQMILSQMNDTTVVESDVIVIALNDNSEEENPNIPIEEIVIEEQEDSVTQDIMGYKTEGKLEYPKLGISYPILSDENEDLLKISLCKYWGPEPNKVGNYCVVGHNYRSGKMFGNLSQATTGDEVKLTDLNGRTITYAVYNKFVVEPTDVSCTSQLTNGKRELTLITCTNYGQQRLVVKAREL